MKASRNDPCPCGSGKKYKSCCMARDGARARAADLVGEEAFAAAQEAWHRAARETPVWEADVVPVLARVRGCPDGPALVMVGAAGFVVSSDLIHHRPATPDERAEAVARGVAGAARVVGVYPETLHVRDPRLARALIPRLLDREVAVQAAPLHELDEALDAALDHLGERPGSSRLVTALTWRELDANAEQLSSFHAAAAAFFEAAPWERYDGDDPLLLRFRDGEEWAVSVLGAAGLNVGLVLYEELEDAFRLTGAGPESGADLLPRLHGTVINVTYDPRADLTRTRQREVARGGWVVAGPDAYPGIYGINLPERRVTAAHLERATLALRAVACAARGGDPLAEAGVRVSRSHGSDEGRPVLWSIPDAPPPILPEGAGADPAAALRWEREVDRFRDGEEARLQRFAAWLDGRDISKARRKAAVRIADAWSEYLAAALIPAGAVTAYDLRSFVYQWLPAEGALPRYALQHFPRELAELIEFLDTSEQIRFPFAAEVLGELETLWSATASSEHSLEEILEEIEEPALRDMEFRLLVPRSLFRDVEVSRTDEVHLLGPLFHELLRRWLLWYDEALRSGVRDWAALDDHLLERQEAWENEPNAAAGGVTPAARVRSLLEDPQPPNRRKAAR